MSCRAAIFHWNKVRAERYARKIEADFNIDAFTMTDYNHETVLLNRALDQCQADYLWFLTPDVAVPDRTTLLSLCEVLNHNSEIGLVVPNREGDPFVGGMVPYQKYLQDNTAMLVRVSTGVRFDEEFIFTGWNDLDFGLETEYQGHQTYVDPRVAVEKLPTAYGAWSYFRAAYNARNRLLLEAKWYWHGREHWTGIEDFNARNPHRRLPTMFELAWWDGDRLFDFARSVEMEHPQILLKDEDRKGTGNETWTLE